MGFLSDIFYFIIVIAVLVVIHEFGHFLAARLCGVRADVFSVGMGARLFGWNRRTGFTLGKLPEDLELEGKTDWRLSLLPIGGYVKISGMVDESFDTDFAGKPAEPWEFRSKGTLAKVFILTGGVLMNFLSAIIIFSALTYSNGEIDLATTKIAYVGSGTVAEKIGFQKGDEILSVNGKNTDSWGNALELLTLEDFGSNRNIVVNRNGGQVTLNVRGSEIIKALADQKNIGIEPAGKRLVLQMVETARPAGKVGLKGGDTVLTLGGAVVVGFDQFTGILKKHKEKPVVIEVKRGSAVISDTLVPDSDGKIGVQFGFDYTGAIIKKEFGPIESISAGWNQTIGSIELFYGSISQLFKGNISFKQSFGGPIMIANQASKSAERGLDSFLTFLAMLSITLAVINILPFPALDGGHLLFTIIEGIIRREIPIKVKMAFQQAGIIILLLFMAIVLYNDIVR